VHTHTYENTKTNNLQKQNTRFNTIQLKQPKENHTNQCKVLQNTKHRAKDHKQMKTKVCRKLIHKTN